MMLGGRILKRTVGVPVLVLAGFPLITGMKYRPSLTVGAAAFCIEHYNDLLTWPS